MKRILIAAMLLGMSSGAWAMDFADLQISNVPDIKAAAGGAAVPYVSVPGRGQRLSGTMPHTKASDLYDDPSMAEQVKIVDAVSKAKSTVDVDAKAMGLVLAREAVRQDPALDLFKMLESQVQKNTVHKADYGEEFKGCSSRVLAFAIVGKPDIYLCKLAFSYEKVYVGQIVIHETAHTMGIRDECVATQVERLVMNAAGVPPFDNGYVSECGLD